MSERRVTIYTALAANVAIAATKLVVATISDSGAMFSEGMHSLVDSGDQLFLLLGLYLSRRPPSARHPYGHGHEVYFWSLVVAMTIFGMGGVVSIYEGVERVIRPAALQSAGWSYIVLAAAFVFEGISWFVAFRGFRHKHRRFGIVEAIERSKDPTTFIVVLEDSAAMLGVIVAAIGIALAHAFDAPVFDAIASIVIGLLLFVVAGVLGRETWSLLLGESAAPELVASIRAIARRQPGVLDVDEPRTMQLGPELVHVDLDLRLDPARSGSELLETTRRVEQAVCEAHPSIRRVSLRFPEPFPQPLVTTD